MGCVPLSVAFEVNLVLLFVTSLQLCASCIGGITAETEETQGGITEETQGGH